MDELVEGGVITPETYVWRTGMMQWQLADTIQELRDAFRLAAPYAAPPPPPTFSEHRPPNPMQGPMQPMQMRQPIDSFSMQVSSQMNPYYGAPMSPVRSDRSRTVGGILQLLLPGVGRMYLGYYAYGALQLALVVCTLGVMWLWSFIDGIVILAGGVKFDGFGRVLTD
jgi:hypothetical protein